MKQQLSALALMAGASLAQAHAGHGLPGLSHWHAGDVALVMAAVALVGLWLARRQ